MSISQHRVVTVGSINIDLVAYAQRRPQAGETYVGQKFTIGAGGKGSNQAIQAALSGAQSFMIGRIGSDIFASYIYEIYNQVGVNYDYVITDDTGTGIGHVIVDGNGDYSAIIVPRANGNLSPDDVDRAKPIIQSAKILLLQLEVPLPTIIHAARLARELGLTIFLNAAPAHPLPKDLLSNVDILIVNEIEAEMLTGLPVGDSIEQYDLVLQTLHRDTNNVVLSLGGRGVIGINCHGEIKYIAGHKVEVVNTIGAGDAFIGELAARMAEGKMLFEALPYANAAGALAVTQATSQAIEVNREMIETLVTRNSNLPDGEIRLPVAQDRKEVK